MLPSKELLYGKTADVHSCCQVNTRHCCTPPPCHTTLTAAGVDRQHCLLSDVWHHFCQDLAGLLCFLQHHQTQEEKRQSESLWIQLDCLICQPYLPYILSCMHVHTHTHTFPPLGDPRLDVVCVGRLPRCHRHSLPLLCHRLLHITTPTGEN